MLTKAEYFLINFEGQVQGRGRRFHYIGREESWSRRYIMSLMGISQNEPWHRRETPDTPQTLKTDDFSDKPFVKNIFFSACVWGDPLTSNSSKFMKSRTLTV